MKSEFITTNGKVIIENGKLHVKKLIYRSSSSGYYVAFLMLYALYIIDKDDKIKPLGYLLLGFAGLALLISFIEILFIYTWKNKFSLDKIKSYKIEKDIHGLETQVILYLGTGRQKKLAFRNHENQLEPFLEMVSQYITQHQFAH